MGCFIVPGAEAIVVKAASKIVEKKEATAQINHEAVSECTHKIAFSRKLKWLSNLQFGGAALLMFEHVWHGEVTPWAPFLTAMSDKGDMIEMFQEMATTGVGMAVLTTLVWGGMLVVVNSMEKRANEEAQKEV